MYAYALKDKLNDISLSAKANYSIRSEAKRIYSGTTHRVTRMLQCRNSWAVSKR